MGVRLSRELLVCLIGIKPVQDFQFYSMFKFQFSSKPYLYWYRKSNSESSVMIMSGIEKV